MLNGDSKELSLTPQINVLYHGLTLVDSGDLKFHVPQFFLLKKGLMTLTCLSGRLQCLLINSDFSKMKSALCVQRAPVVCRSCHFHHLHTDLSQTHTYRQNNVLFFFFFWWGVELITRTPEKKSCHITIELSSGLDPLLELLSWSWHHARISCIATFDATLWSDTALPISGKSLTKAHLCQQWSR